MKKRIIALLLSLVIIFPTLFFSKGNPVYAEESETEYYNNISGGLFESAADVSLWTQKNKQDQTISFDSNNYYDGCGSLKIEMPTAYYSPLKPLYLTSATVDGAEKSFKTNEKYNVEMYIKTSADFTGSIYMRLRQGNSFVQYASSADLLLLGTKTGGVKGCDDWLKIKTQPVSLKQEAVTVVLYVNGKGTVWFDNINIKVNDEMLENGGFENNTTGWDSWGSIETSGTSAEISTDVTCLSNKALKMSVDNTASDGTVLYMVKESALPDADKQYTLSLDLKTVNAGKDSVYVRLCQYYYDENEASVTKWLSCNGTDNAVTTGGTKDWTHYEVKLSGFEKTLTNLLVMIYIGGPGTAYFDNISIVKRVKPIVKAGEIVPDVKSGEVDANTCVTLFCADNYDIYYTVDGTNPLTSKTALLNNEHFGFLVTDDVEIRACAVSGNTVGKEYNFKYDCINPIINSDELWQKTNASAAVSLDTETKQSGQASIRINGGSNVRYISTDDIRINSAFDYKLEFWAKTRNISNSDNAFVNVFMPGSGSVQFEFDNRYGSYVKTKNIISGIRGNKEWTHYELILDDLDNYWDSVVISAGVRNDSGTLWIDGVKLTALPYEYYPLSVSSDGETFGNNYYYKNIPADFVLNEGFILTNQTNNDENADITYKVYNDMDKATIIESGTFNNCVIGENGSDKSLTLNNCNSFGTYTVEFSAKNSRNYSYSIGEIKFAIIRDASGSHATNNFGVNGYSIDFDLLKKSGVRMMRADFHWKTAEPAEGEFTVSEGIDRLVSKCNQNDIDLIMILGDGSGPSWFKAGDTDRFPKTDAEIAQFIRYVKNTVNYFKGKVKYYELYNETNIAFNASGAQYAKLLKAFYSAVKEVDSTAYVLSSASAGVHLSWAESVLKQDVGNYMDFWSCHPYANPQSPESRNWIEEIEQLEALIKRYTGRQIPLILDEFGWSDNESSGGVNQAEQLKWYVRTMAYADKVDYIKSLVAYNDACGGARNKYTQELRWGMFDSSYSTTGYAHPFVAGVSNFLYMTDGYNLSECTVPENGFHVFKYNGTNDNLYMMWTQDTDKTLTVTTSDKSAVIYDIFGNEIKFAYDQNSFSVNIDGNPIYIRLNKGETVTETLLSDRIIDDSEDNNVVIEDFEATNPDILNTGCSIDSTKAFSGNKSIKIDLSTSRYPEYGLPGVKLIFRPDMNTLDVNKKYRFRLTICSDNKNLKFNSLVRFFGDEDGKTTSAGWNTYGFDDFLLLADTNLGSAFTTYTAFETFMPFGNDFHIVLALWTDANATGNVWIDKVEVVPVDEGFDDGVVRVTGYDAETGGAIYTAYANDGYTVDDIVATAYNASTTPIYSTVTVLDRSYDNKTVEFKVTGLGNNHIVTNGNVYGNHTTVNPVDVRYITVSFGSDMPVLRTADDKYIVSDFETDAPDNYGNCTSEHFGKGKRCFSSSNSYDEVVLYLDSNTVHKFDASNNYKLSAFLKSTSDWNGVIQLSAYALFSGKKISLRSDLWKGEYDILNLLPNESWNEYYIDDNCMLPLAGERIQLILKIQRTSQSGTVFIDDVSLSPNGLNCGAIEAVDYSKKHGYVKTTYNSENDSLIFTPTAFDGYEYDDMSVEFRAVGKVTYNGKEYENCHCPMEKQLEKIISVREKSYAVSLLNISETERLLCFQTHSYLGTFCEASFKPLVIGVKGDANNDNKFNILDLVRAKKYLADNRVELRIVNIDYNLTSFFDMDDLIMLRKELLIY